MDQNQLNELLLFRLSHPIDKHTWFGKSKQVAAAKRMISNRHMLCVVTGSGCDVKELECYDYDLIRFYCSKTIHENWFLIDIFFGKWQHRRFACVFFVEL